MGQTSEGQAAQAGPASKVEDPPAAAPHKGLRLLLRGLWERPWLHLLQQRISRPSRMKLSRWAEVARNRAQLEGLVRRGATCQFCGRAEGSTGHLMEVCPAWEENRRFWGVRGIGDLRTKPVEAGMFAQQVMIAAWGAGSLIQ